MYVECTLPGSTSRPETMSLTARTPLREEIRGFLTQLAVERDVTAGTQNQAKCALLFLFQEVMGRELEFLDVTRADKPERLPVVLSRRESDFFYRSLMDSNASCSWSCTVPGCVIVNVADCE
jgi:hypothetical protein